VDITQEYLAFRKEARTARQVFDTFCTLFSENDRTQDLLKRTAHSFFFDLSNWLADYHVVCVARITDPSESYGNMNLTTHKVVASLRAQKKLLNDQDKDKIEIIHEKILSYRKLVESWRNKRVVHLDYDVVAKGDLSKLSQSHTLKEIKEFYSDLDRFCYLIELRLGLDPYNTLRVAQGDAGVSALIVKLQQVYPLTGRT
jgi:hypothetical protein